MPETYGTRPISWYADQAPDKLWEEEDEEVLPEPDYKEPCPRCGWNDSARFILVKGWITLVCKKCAWMWDVYVKEVKK